ncbi:MAG: MBL fold metallo-hydrolase [Chloroflexota bacterium]
MIIETLEVGPIAANCYIVGDETTKEGLIIDPGDEASRILKKVKYLNLKIKAIVLTHSHFDHIGAAKQVKQSTGAELAAHADDARGLIESPPDRLLKGGDKIEIGKLSFLVLHTPGHSAGGISLLGQGVVFTGDTLFNFGIGRTDFPGSSYSQIMTSIHTKLLVLPDNTVVYPGHGPKSTIGIERQHNPFLRG